jgi:hypothetical protein
VCNCGVADQHQLQYAEQVVQAAGALHTLKRTNTYTFFATCAAVHLIAPAKGCASPLPQLLSVCVGLTHGSAPREVHRN